MLGFLFIYFVGKYFYDLAFLYNENKWLFAILGIASYYIGTFAGGLLLGVLSELGWIGSIQDMSDIVIGLLALPLGFLSCWIFYIILKKRWSNRSPIIDENKTLDGDGIERGSGL